MLRGLKKIRSEFGKKAVTGAQLVICKRGGGDGDHRGRESGGARSPRRLFKIGERERERERETERERERDRERRRERERQREREKE